MHVVTHPAFAGFDLEPIDDVQTPRLKQLAAKLKRSDVDAPIEPYRVHLFGPDEDQPVSTAEVIHVPKANRLQLVHDESVQGIDCESPEEGIRQWLDQHEHE